MGKLMRLYALVVCAVLLTASVLSQVTRTYTSLESKVGQAESVYRGTIVDVSHQAGVPASLEPSSGHSESLELTVRVEETLKGRPAQTLTLGVKTVVPLACYQAYARERTQFLWFINSGKSGSEWNDSWVLRGYAPKDPSAKSPSQLDARYWESHRLGPEVPEHFGYSDGDGMNVFSMDFKVLTSPEDILACARVFAKHHPKVVRSIKFEIPKWVGNWCGRPADGNSLFAPSVPELERVGHWLMNSPSILLDRSDETKRLAEAQRHPGQRDEDALRLVGIYILRNFKSAKNSALLQKLLDDPSFSVEGGSRGGRTKVYRIRQAAFEVLKSWGTKVPKPVVEEPMP